MARSFVRRLSVATIGLGAMVQLGCGSDDPVSEWGAAGFGPSIGEGGNAGTGGAAGAAAGGGEAGSAQPAGPPGGKLAGLPSAPGPHMAQIAALGAGEWLDLGAPAADPDWGIAWGRAYTPKMALAPGLGGAFLFGLGAHGAYNSDTRRWPDDLWFYDLLAHRWISLYPGWDMDAAPAIVNQDGFIALAGDSPIPIATMAHGYESTAWDPITMRFLHMECRGGDYWNAHLPWLTALIHEQADRQVGQTASPWIYDAVEARWDRRPATGDSPAHDKGDVLMYLPSVGKTFLAHGGGVWLYDGPANHWDRVTTAGPLPEFGIDGVATYDSARDRIYLGGGTWPNVPSGESALWIYDVQTETWVDPAPSGYPGGNIYTTSMAMLHYDAAADEVLLFRHGHANNVSQDRYGTRGIYAYDPSANGWQPAGTDFPVEWSEGWASSGSNGFFHSELNVHVFHVAGDSHDNGRVLVYRHALSP